MLTGRPAGRLGGHRSGGKREPMTRLKRYIARFFLGLEKDFNTVRHTLRTLFRPPRPFEVVPYLGYGTGDEVFLKGRVLEDKGVSLGTPEATRWRNLVNTYKRFVSDEVPNAELELRFGGVRRRLVTNEQGYFDTAAALELPGGASESASGATNDTVSMTEEGWAEVEVRLLKPTRGGEVSTKSAVLVPPAGAAFGVISDIDDTVVQTDATRWVRVLSSVLFGNAYTRLPFKGVAAFYRALQGGGDGERHNPLFYVSSSPWNLYDLLLEFFRAEGIPRGPLMLRSWRGGGFAPSEHGSFKSREIRRILDMFPHLPFILIGDSGQEDPEIYHDIVSAYPGRILGVYIRNVSRNPDRPEAIARLSGRIKELGSTLVLADDTLAAAQHAAGRGWISPQALPEIRSDKEKADAPFEEHRDTEATVIGDPDRESAPVRQKAETN